MHHKRTHLSAFESLHFVYNCYLDVNNSTFKYFIHKEKVFASKGLTSKKFSRLFPVVKRFKTISQYQTV